MIAAASSASGSALARASSSTVRNQIRKAERSRLIDRSRRAERAAGVLFDFRHADARARIAGSWPELFRRRARAHSARARQLMLVRKGNAAHRRTARALLQKQRRRAVGVMPEGPLHAVPEHAAVLGNDTLGVRGGIRVVRFRPVDAGLWHLQIQAPMGSRRTAVVLVHGPAPASARAALPRSPETRAGLLGEVWQRLPLALTRQVGPHLRKYLIQ